MDHKAEQIMVAILSLLSDSVALVTTGGRVKRGRVYPNSDAILPALSLYMGADRPADEPNMQHVDRLMQINITAHVKQSADTSETAINQIKKEVYIAMLASRSVGLPGFVMDCFWLSDGAPELKDGSNKPVGDCEMTFMVSYRTNYNDPSL